MLYANVEVVYVLGGGGGRDVYSITGNEFIFGREKKLL